MAEGKKADVAADALAILTIGHSTHRYEDFLALLRQAAVTALVDVRSMPYSRYLPHYNREPLRQRLRDDGLAYVYLGEALGGRPARPAFFRDGVADFEQMARTEDFAHGLARVIEGAKTYRIALMCAEHDPLDCHRCLLVGRALHDYREERVAVRHILSDGAIIDHAAIEARLLAMSGRNTSDLFDSPDQRLAAAYRDRAAKVAYSDR